MTARPLERQAVVQLLEQRQQKRERGGRRPSLAAMAERAGETREGMVIRIEAYGVLVNVGARRPGLVHISQLDRSGPRGGRFVNHPSEIVSVGDQVLVKILPKSNQEKLV